MSSTDPRQEQQAKQQEAALRTFYEQHVMPLHGKVDLDYPALPERADSFYRRRSGEAPRKEDFELGLRDAKRIAAALDAFWAGTPLAGMGRKLAELSEQFHGKAQEGEVSQYIYEMF